MQFSGNYWDRQIVILMGKKTVVALLLLALCSLSLYCAIQPAHRLPVVAYAHKNIKPDATSSKDTNKWLESSSTTISIVPDLLFNAVVDASYS